MIVFNFLLSNIIKIVPFLHEVSLSQNIFVFKTITLFDIKQVL
jgi:hypothetical protein